VKDLVLVVILNEVKDLVLVVVLSVSEGPGLKVHKNPLQILRRLRLLRMTAFVCRPEQSEGPGSAFERPLIE